nr:hypothetical protein [Tanacetum cinerariifolium]
SSGTNHYLGPLTFLILLYLDSTKFDRFLVVRIRPAIKNWSTYLMKQRQESELKRRVLGLLDLHVEWTEAEVQDTEGFIGSLEFSEKKKLNIKVGLKRKMSGSDSVDSSSIDIAKVKRLISKLERKVKKQESDKENYGIFTMLHMETFNGGPALSFKCGLPSELQLQRDMLRRLRFKFVTKILLHEINVLAKKMLEIANELDKIDHVEKMAIIVDAFKNREERERI